MGACLRVHHPTPQASPGYPRAYLEDGDPSIANVVKVDGAFEGVGVARAADVVVAVPVDAEAAGV